VTPELTNLWLKALGGTRFLLTVGNGLVCSFLLLAGVLDGNQFVTIVLSTTAVYIGADTYHRVKAKQVDGATPAV
jgi:hypothetical protein